MDSLDDDTLAGPSGKGLSINDVTTDLTFSDPPPPYKSDVSNIYPIYGLIQVYIYVFNEYWVHILHTCF